MTTPSRPARRDAYRQMIDRFGGSRYRSDWSDSRDHHRRLLSEFIGTFGLVIVLSFGAAILTARSQPHISNTTLVTLLSATSSLWLVVSIYALGDVSAHFNPAMTFAYAVRGDMSWRRAAIYWVVQFAGALAAAGLARAWFGPSSGLASVGPPPGQAWSAMGFEALLTGGFVLLILATTQGPKLNGPFTPLAVAAYIMSLGTVGGLFEGAAMNPARALGPNLAVGRLQDAWVYVLGPVLGALAAVGLDRLLRGPATVGEAEAAESESAPAPGGKA